MIRKPANRSRTGLGGARIHGQFSTMELVAGPLLVFLAVICYVQCQWDQTENPEGDFINPRVARTLNRGRSSHKDGSSTQFRPASAPVSRDLPPIVVLSEAESTRRRRTRRQSSSWTHQFTIAENEPASLTKETVYIWQEYTKQLKHTLEKDTHFEFLTPTGFRILIPANNIDMKILDYRVKLNEEFRGNDGGHFTLSRYKKNNMWVYEIPNLKLRQGDRLFYWLRLTLGKEAFDVIVKGVFDITKGNPHITAPYMETVPFRPQASVLAPQTYSNGGSREAFEWQHLFTINLTNNNPLTKESASSWQRYAEFLKSLLQKRTTFKFSNPTGLMISIPDDSINIVDFRIKHNDEFRENDAGHFAPTAYKRDNMRTYVIPQLRIQPGDVVYYWMRVKHIQDGFEAIVRGKLEIIKGNPHTDSFSNNPIVWAGQPSVVGGQPLIGGGQPSTGGGQSPTGGGQPSIGGGQPSTGSDQSPTDRFGQPEDNGGQTFKWNHKFTSVNLNITPEVGLTYDSETLPDKVDEYFKKMLDRDIEFEYLNPVGLRILLSGGDNLRILTFNIKLNEEFKGFEASHYNALVDRRSDGRWRYTYPNLKLKQGDKAYYWMRVTFGKEMWLYVVKGYLDIILGDPHNVFNSIGKPPPSPRPTYNSIQTTTPSARPTYNSIQTTPTPRPTNTVDKPPMGESGGQPEWDHNYSIIKTYNDGSAPKDEQLVKKIVEKNIKFKFLNPSGLSILFSGEDEDYRVLAFNIKLNEKFKSLSPGHYVANVTRTREGRLNYYYPNLKVKPGDVVYYWARVAQVQDMADYVVTGELGLKRGDAHVGGPVADVPAPIILTQTQPRPAEASAALPNYQPPNQASPTSSPVVESKASILSTPTQTTIPPNKKVPLPNYQTPSTETPLPNQSHSPAEPLPLSVNLPPSPASVAGTPTRLCAASQPGQNEDCQEVLVTYNVNKMYGSHQIIIDAKNPIHLSLGVQNNPENAGS